MPASWPCPVLVRTPEGWEGQFATNHLGHAAPPSGSTTPSPRLGPRVVVVASAAHLMAPVDVAALAYVGAKDEHRNTLALPPGWRTPQQGAATTVLLAASPLVEGITGRYFEDVRSPRAARAVAGKSGVAPYALDEDAAECLWRETLRLLAVS